MNTACTRPLVIPVFIPHEGCPHRCIFCNQQQISGEVRPPVSAAEVTAIITEWLHHGQGRAPVQVAFYGGSFTGLPLTRQERLLAAVAPFIEQGQVQEIRLSTRPDYIDEERLALLARFHVRVIELGVQSCDDAVLARAGRGHSFSDIKRAAELIRAAGFQLGMQLMLGLPGQGFAQLRATMSEVIRLAPDLVRIYPVLVLAGSGLAALQARGDYQPLTLARAVLLAAYMKKRFDAVGIPVVRMGLQPGPELEQSLVAGPYHPAFGELVQARLMFKKTRKLLAAGPTGAARILFVNDRDQSVFRGPHAACLKRLERLGLWPGVTLRTDPAQPRFTVRLETAPACAEHTL